MPLTDLEDRLTPEPNTGCLLWTGTDHGDGYGIVRVAGRLWRVHRLVWTRLHGLLAPGVCVLHRCDTPACANPQHLFLGSRAENNRDKARKGRTPVSVHRLSATEVRAIRNLRGRLSQSMIAIAFRVTRPAISQIHAEKRWRT